MANQIRNIAQTASEREVVKTAPDVVVYIEGRPYLINPFINSQDPAHQQTGEGSYTAVQFNDFLDSFSASYGTDDLIPTATITLSVPNHLKRLFQSPAGGSNVLEPMMEVQVFAKGYFPSIRGNTLYYRVFKGLISSVSYADTGTNVQISVGCHGILRFLELMRIDLAAALLSNAPADYLTPLRSNQAAMDPYKQLADTFLRDVTPAGFYLNSIQQRTLAQANPTRSDWSEAVQQGYILKWQAKLTNLVRDVRILGYDMKKSPITTEGDPYLLPDALSHEPEDAKGQLNPQTAADRGARLPKDSPTTTRNDPDLYIDIMRKYLPDMGVNTISLLNGKITSRLERIRTIVNLIMYEGYQDIDGAIIFKPPLYNLDVTNVGSPDPNVSTRSAANYITEGTNPYVVHLSEIESETETEDEQSIRATRMSMQGDWLTNLHFDSQYSSTLLPVVDHIDIAKLAKFGLREEPVRQLPFIKGQDTKTVYAYAASEMVRANRDYRTYTMTIPLRPELRLGFPIYLPHKDMYGYIKLVSISYQQGQSATMQVTLDAIRKRLLIPSQKTVNGQTTTTYTSQPNLVMQWTAEPPPNTVSTTTPPFIPNPFVPSAASAPGSTTSPYPTLPQPGNNPTVTQPQDSPFSQDEWAYITHQRETTGNMWSSRFDTKTHCFRIQNDEVTAADIQNQIADDGTVIVNGSAVPTVPATPTTPARHGSPALIVTEPFFNKNTWANGIDIRYYHKILSTQPYTDDKGYEVVSPFPWGRWVTLLQAIRETRLGILTPPSETSFAASEVPGVYTFLFAGLASPTDPSIASQLNSVNSSYPSPSSGAGPASSYNLTSKMYDSVEQDSVIELITIPGQPGTDQSLTSSSQPDMLTQIQKSDLASIRSTVDVFLTGGVSTPNSQSVKQLQSTPPGTGTPAPSIPDFLQGTASGVKRLLTGGSG